MKVLAIKRLKLVGHLSLFCQCSLRSSSFVDKESLGSNFLSQRIPFSFQLRRCSKITIQIFLSTYVLLLRSSSRNFDCNFARSTWQRTSSWVDFHSFGEKSIVSFDRGRRNWAANLHVLRELHHVKNAWNLDQEGMQEQHTTTWIFFKISVELQLSTLLVVHVHYSVSSCCYCGSLSRFNLVSVYPCHSSTLCIRIFRIRLLLHHLFGKVNNRTMKWILDLRILKVLLAQIGCHDLYTYKQGDKLFSLKTNGSRS